MNYKLEISDYIDRLFFKLSKKDKHHFEILKKKIPKILENPFKFKPLRNNMSGLRRIHIGKSFVLTFQILENKKTIRLLDYNHHDKIYKK